MALAALLSVVVHPGLREKPRKLLGCAVPYSVHAKGPFLFHTSSGSSRVTNIVYSDTSMYLGTLQSCSGKWGRVGRGRMHKVAGTS